MNWTKLCTNLKRKIFYCDLLYVNNIQYILNNIVWHTLLITYCDLLYVLWIFSLWCVIRHCYIPTQGPINFKLQLVTEFPFSKRNELLLVSCIQFSERCSWYLAYISINSLRIYPKFQYIRNSGFSFSTIEKKWISWTFTKKDIRRDR